MPLDVGLPVASGFVAIAPALTARSVVGCPRPGDLDVPATGGCGLPLGDKTQGVSANRDSASNHECHLGVDR